ncbi:MAG: DUF3244 domain-containing protein [Bacteroidales bacterium]|jgi:hypothetical protein|nr:DUF3244 domain-containing protein [Bacteroidales bacterium]
MKYLKNRLIVLMLMLMIPNAWTLADNCYLSDNHHPIQIKASHVQGVPKGFTIQASINGHTLTVAFSQNIGQVEVEITTVTGSTVDCLSILTPNGLQSYIPNTGDYIVTFTLSNGDEYYGEFTVSD